VALEVGHRGAPSQASPRRVSQSTRFTINRNQQRVKITPDAAPDHFLNIASGSALGLWHKRKRLRKKVEHVDLVFCEVAERGGHGERGEDAQTSMPWDHFGIGLTRMEP
jgi:hypothetical protein